MIKVYIPPCLFTRSRFCDFYLFANVKGVPRAEFFAIKKRLLSVATAFVGRSESGLRPMVTTSGNLDRLVEMKCEAEENTTDRVNSRVRYVITSHNNEGCLSVISLRITIYVWTILMSAPEPALSIKPIDIFGLPRMLIRFLIAGKSPTNNRSDRIAHAPQFVTSRGIRYRNHTWYLKSVALSGFGFTTRPTKGLLTFH
jgi:hypothetical protein